MTTLFPKPLDKSVSQTQDGLAIVANGNTHAAISSGQFVYVKNHDTLAEGLYKATSAIEQNGALSTSNLTPDGTGGLNDLQGQVTALNSKITQITVTSGTGSAATNSWWEKSWDSDDKYAILFIHGAQYETTTLYLQTSFGARKCNVHNSYKYTQSFSYSMIHFKN